MKNWREIRKNGGKYDKMARNMKKNGEKFEKMARNLKKWREI